MTRLETIHPMIVHFPVALLCTAFLLYILYFIKRNDLKKSELFKGAFRLVLILGTISVAAAVGTGLLAESRAMHNEAAHEIIEKFHEPFGLSVLALAVFLCFWGVVTKWDFSGPKAYAYLLVFSATFVVLLLTGYYGGKLVYEHGMGVNPNVLIPVEHEHDHGGEGHEQGEVHEHDAGETNETMHEESHEATEAEEEGAHDEHGTHEHEH